MTNFSRFLLLVTSSLFLFSPASAQYVLLYQKNGAAAGDYLGNSVASAGDVNGDGRADFLIGAHLANPGGVFDAGSAYVYSGATGALLYQKNGAFAGDSLGFSVAGAGDVNGDGRADFIIGAPGANPGGLGNAGSAYVYSGMTGALLYQKNGAAAVDRLGFSVAGAGDVNGDGRADFIIGAPFVGFAGSAYAYSGTTGGLLVQKNASALGDRFGSTVAGAGDVNGDGRADFIIGAPGANLGGLNDAGSAYLYSGATGGLFYQKNGTLAGDGLGNSVSGAGDVNGDSRPDFIIGAPGANPGGLVDAGSAFVYSGATGALLYQKNGAFAADSLGYSVAGAGDVNGGGRADLIIGAPGASLGDAGSAFVYSGMTGGLLVQKDGAEATDFFGLSVASAGDVNGDGKSDFIIGAYSANPGGLANAGSAYVFGLCAAAKGDMNGVNGLTPADVVLMLNCVFLGTGTCDLCFADVNCSSDLTPADVVLELNAVFLASSFPC